MVHIITKIYNGRIILGNEIVEENLYFDKDKIVAVTSDELGCERVIDACGCYVSPGFVDIHQHGGFGFEYSDASREAIVSASNGHAMHGTTTVFPTIAANSSDELSNALQAIGKYGADEQIIPNLPGVHLEGPYFSPKQCGAQNMGQLRVPEQKEYRKLISEFGTFIKLWSYAPELDRELSFLKTLNDNGIVAAAGHTDATYDDMKRAYDNGCRHITHLYSCTSTITRENGFRKLGVIETAYLYDDIYVEAIADGCHLPPELLELIYKIKGAEHICLITDSIRFGGLKGDTTDTSSIGGAYIIEDGVAKLPDRSAFAGSIATSDVLVRTCVKKAGIPLVDAVKMLTDVPCRVMNLKSKGALKVGYDADIIIFDENINMQSVIVGGKVHNEIGREITC